MSNYRIDKQGRTWIRVGRLHRRRGDGLPYYRFHWTCIG